MAHGLLILVRHGESAWNAEGRLQGQADAPLSDLGREQAQALGEPLAELPRAGVVSSDLSRAVDTAVLAGHTGAARDPRWRERSMGEWTTELEADVPQDRLLAFRRGELVPPGGESWAQLQARVGEAVDELADRGGTWLVFTHGGPVRAAVAHATGADHRTIVGPANTSLTLIELGAPRRLLVFNWVPGARGIPRERARGRRHRARRHPSDAGRMTVGPRGHRETMNSPPSGVTPPAGREGAGLDVDLARHGPATVLRLRGELDLRTVPRLREGLARAVAEDGGDVVVDLAAVGFVDSTGLSALLNALRRLTRARRRLVLAGAHGQVEKMLRLTRLDSTFVLAGSVEDALPPRAAT